MDYFLTSARLGFRCWREDDLALANQLWGDLEVTALMGGPFTPESIRSRLEQEMARMRDLRIQYWPIFLLDHGLLDPGEGGDQFAGCAGLRPRPREERIYQMGYHLRPPFWGQGIATEAARAVIDHAFGTLGAEALSAAHHPLNDRSRRVLLKLGFAEAGEEFYPPTGLMHPSYRLRRN
jgi:[ribosomal protein S5]-alanine N-acetyltransferase